MNLLASVLSAGITLAMFRAMNIVSILIGLVVLAMALVGFIPFLGWLNWLTIPVAIVGAALGALSSHNAGRNLNIFLLIVCGIRLALGGGLI